MDKSILKKIYLAVLACVVAFFISFYFLTGDSLKYRDSRFNIFVGDGNIATKEIVLGDEVRQNFAVNIDRIEYVAFQVTTFYRENSGNLYAYLYDGSHLLMEDYYDVGYLQEGQYVRLETDGYLEGLNGKQLTLVLKSDCQEGRGIALLTNSNSTQGINLKVNKYYMNGSLSFAVQGQEFIFTGQWYWLMAALFTLAVMIVLGISYYRFVNHKHGYIASAIFAIQKYSFLISQLVARDFKTKYKRSILGVFWSFLNPLLTMVVQFIVFSTIFRNDVKYYPAYLLSGIVIWSFFNEVTNMCLHSITGNASLITKVYMPKYIYPVSRTLSSGINLLISLVPLLLVSLITGVHFLRSILLIPFFLICLIVFSLGVGMFLSALMVFFRDIAFLWSVIVMAWMYATPIFYSPEIIPERFSFILKLNPLYHFIKNIRMCLIEGVSPGPRSYIFCFLFAMISLLVGSLVFKKTQDKFTLYL